MKRILPSALIGTLPALAPLVLALPVSALLNVKSASAQGTTLPGPANNPARTGQVPVGPAMAPPKLPPAAARPLPVVPPPTSTGMPQSKVPGLDLVSLGAHNPDPLARAVGDDRLRQDAVAPVMDLVDAIAITLSNNPQRLEAQAAVNEANANIVVQNSLGQPEVDLSGTSAYARNTGSNVPVGASNEYSRGDQLAAIATEPITTGGRVKYSTRAARFEALAQIYSLAQTEQNLVLATTLAYLDVLRTNQLLHVANANLAVALDQLNVAKIRLSVGADTNLDVLNAQTTVSAGRTARIEAVDNVANAEDALNTLLGRAPQSPLRLADVNRLTLPAVPLAVTPTGSVQTPPTISTTSVTPGGPAAPATTVTAAGAAPTTAGSAATPAGVTTVGTPAVTAGAGTSATGTTTAGTATAGTATAGTTAVGTTAATTAAGTSTTGAATTGAATTGAATTGAATTGTTTASTTTPSSTGLQAAAGTSNQSLAVTEAEIGAAQANIEVAKSNQRPQIAATFEGLLRNPATFLGHFGASIGLGLAQDLFDSRRTKSEIAEAQDALAGLQAFLASQKLEVGDAIDASINSLDAAERSQDSAADGIASAAESLRITLVGFRSGVNTTLDVDNARASLISAETTAVNARFDVASSQATLAAAVGIYTVEAQRAHDRATSKSQNTDTQAAVLTKALQPKPKSKHHKFLGIF